MHQMCLDCTWVSRAPGAVLLYLKNALYCGLAEIIEVFSETYVALRTDYFSQIAFHLQHLFCLCKGRGCDVGLQLLPQKHPVCLF